MLPSVHLTSFRVYVSLFSNGHSALPALTRLWYGDCHDPQALLGLSAARRAHA